MTNPVFPANEPRFSAIVAAESISLAMLNAVTRQQLDSMTAQAATVMGIAMLCSINTAVTGAEWKKVLDAATPAAPTAPAAPAAGPAPATTEVATAAIDAIANSKATEDTIESAARMIAVTMALAVQDAANYLRNVQTLSTASTACSLLLKPNAVHGVSEDSPALTAAVSALDHSSAQFERFCHRATDILAQLQSLRSAGGEREAKNTAGDSDLLQATAEALSVAVRNAVTIQQQVNVTAQSAAVMGVSTLYSLDTATIGVGTEKILDSAKPTAPQIETAAPVA
jgi:hypothetical protein